MTQGNVHTDRAHIHHIWGGVVKVGFKWVGIGFLALMAYLSIDTLAGETTDANILVNFSATATAEGVVDIGENLTNLPENMVVIDRDSLILGRFTKEDFWTYLFLLFVIAVAITMYTREVRLRKQTIRSLGERNEILERLIDSDRSSSNLTQEGETNPQDR